MTLQKLALMTALLTSLVACTGSDDDPKDSSSVQDSSAAEDSSAVEDSPDDSSTADSAEDTEDECRDEGESCEIYEDGRSNCCNGRHTCFPEGCYYTQP